MAWKDVEAELIDRLCLMAVDLSSFYPFGCFIEFKWNYGNPAIRLLDEKTLELLISEDGKEYSEFEAVKHIYKKARGIYMLHDWVGKDIWMNIVTYLYDQIDSQCNNWVWEWCPNCDSEVKINSLRPSHCPKCGEPIKPCAMCDMDKVNCDECKFDKENEHE